jgi:hypothetical protein
MESEHMRIELGAAVTKEKMIDDVAGGSEMKRGRDAERERRERTRGERKNNHRYTRKHRAA